MWNWHLVIHGEVAGWLTALGTLFLAGAACYALKQLSEAKNDRHVQVFSDMGRRWESEEMMETLKLEAGHTPESLLELFELAGHKRFDDPTQEATRTAARRDRSVLLRIPNYFEEAMAIQKVGSLRLDLMDDYFGGVAKDSWYLWEPTIKKLQETDETAFIEFGRMAERAD